MPADVQIRRILSFLDCLMRASARRALLVAGFGCYQLNFRSRASNSLRVRAIFFSTAASSASAVFNFSFAIRAASAPPRRARTSSARSSGRRARFAHNARRERFQVGRRRIKRVQIGKLFQKIAIGSFALLNAPLHAGSSRSQTSAVLFAWLRF